MSKTKTIKSDLNTLITALESKDIKVTTKSDTTNCINLKLTSDNALDVIVAKLVELAVNNEVVISANSLVENNSYDIYIEIN